MATSGKRTFNERVAVAVTSAMQSMGFFWWSLFGILGWMAWNITLPRLRFDSPPWFPVLLFILNLGQWLAIGIVAVGQGILQADSLKREEENAQILRNQIVTMGAVKSLLERDLELAKSADERLRAIEREVSAN